MTNGHKISLQSFIKYLGLSKRLGWFEMNAGNVDIMLQLYRSAYIMNLYLYLYFIFHLLRNVLPAGSS